MEDKTPATFSSIPIDLITSEILPRLPAKTLVRFSAVCKSWYSLIRNPDFVNANLRLNLSRPIIRCFLGTCHCNRDAIVNPCDCNLDSFSDRFIASENLNGKPAVHLLGFDLPFLRHIGSCKGLISLRLSGGRGEVIILYNPSIRMMKVVEKCPPQDSNYLYRFGYNERSNDHRLLKVTCKKSKNLDFDSSLSRDFWHKTRTQQVEVYSLTTDSWHEIDQQVPPRLLLENWGTSGLYLNGVSYWLTRSESNENSEFPVFLNAIVSFDFHQEVFREVMLPRELQVNGNYITDISEFKGSLALLVQDEYRDLDGYNFKSDTFYIWVMRRDGVVESWKKLYEICLPEYEPRGLLRDGTVVLLKHYGGKFEVVTAFYGLENRQVKDFARFYYYDRVDDFTESLLLLGLDNVRYCPDGFFIWFQFL